ncbi:MAG: transposase, partial [Pseudomonadota bacterium]
MISRPCVGTNPAFCVRMSRMARIVVPGIPHHVTQRGNRRQLSFFRNSDFDTYLKILGSWCRRTGLDVWAYCLMPNHVHLIVVPPDQPSLARGIGEAHKGYSRLVNERHGWKGYLWQGRFASFPMDEGHLLAAARYVERNPVEAGIVHKPEDYPWSSVC